MMKKLEQASLQQEKLSSLIHLASYMMGRLNVCDGKVTDALFSDNNFVLAETVQSGVADYQKQVNEFYRVFNPDVSTGSDLQLAFLYNGVLADGKPVAGVANMVETFLNAYQED